MDMCKQVIVYFVIVTTADRGHGITYNVTPSTSDIGPPITYPVNSTDANLYQNMTDAEKHNITSGLNNNQTKEPTEKDLLQLLFKDYDCNARPVKHISHKVDVDTSLRLVSIDHLNEREQILTTYAWFNMQWIDEYMTWDPENWAGIKVVIVPGHKVWSPDVVIRNSAKSLRGDILDEEKVYKYIITYFGRVKLWTAGSITTSCQVDMTYFPFDDQVCQIGVDSWIYPMTQLNMRNASDRMDLSIYQKSGEWTLLNTNVTSRIDSYVEPEGVYNYSVLEYNIYLRRKSTYYIYNIVVPTVIMSLLVLLIFLLPAESGEKVSLGITVLLSFTVFQLVIADSLPKTSDSVSVIVIYLLCTMILTSISLVCSVGILSLHHHHDSEAAVPQWLSNLVFFLSRALTCDGCQTKSSKKDNRDRENGIDNIGCDVAEAIHMESNNREEENGESNCANTKEKDIRQNETKLRWRQVARTVDLILLVIFLALNLITTVLLLGIYPLWKPNTNLD